MPGESSEHPHSRPWALGVPRGSPQKPTAQQDAAGREVVFAEEPEEGAGRDHNPTPTI